MSPIASTKSQRQAPSSIGQRWSSILLSLVVVGTACAHKPQLWHRFETDHVILKTNAAPSRGEQLVRDLEKFRTTIGVLTQLDLSNDPSPKLRVFGFDSIHQYQSAANSRGGSVGFYVMTVQGPVSLLDISQGDGVFDLTGQNILFHEYTHHLLRQYSPFPYPTWYNEGFADFLSTATFDGSRVTIGTPVANRLLALQKTSEWLRVEELMNQRSGYMSSRSRLRSSRTISAVSFQYAQGWLLTHMLHNTPRYKPGLSRYLADTAKGAHSEDAFATAFGITYQQMDAELHRYWGSKELRFSVYNLKGRVGTIRVDRSRLPPEAAPTVEYEARVLSRRAVSFDAADRTFSLAAERGYQRERMTELRARLALADERYDEAEARINELQRLSPKSATVPVLRATAVLGRKYNKEKARVVLAPDDVARIHALCRTAMQLDPQNPPARLLFVRASIVGKQATEHDLQLVNEARALSPGLPGLARSRVLVLMQLKRYGEALVEVDQMIAWAHKRSVDDLIELREKILARQQS